MWRTGWRQVRRSSSLYCPCVLYIACSIRDVPVERNPQYLILSLYCIFRINLTQHKSSVWRVGRTAEDRLVFRRAIKAAAS